MELPSVDAASSVYFKYTDHFAGAIEGWSDAEIITADQRKAITDACPIVDAAATALRNALNTRANAERAVTKLRARYGIRDIILDKRILATSDAVLNGAGCDSTKLPPGSAHPVSWGHFGKSG